MIARVSACTFIYIILKVRRRRLCLSMNAMRCATPTTIAGFQLNTTVPAGAVAVVVLPAPAGSSAGSVSVTEGGKAVITKGVYVPGVAGITGGAVQNMGASTGLAATINVGSGVYSFTLSG